MFYCDFVAVVNLQREKYDDVHSIQSFLCALVSFSSEFSVLEATIIEQGRDGDLSPSDKLVSAGPFHRSVCRGRSLASHKKIAE